MAANSDQKVAIVCDWLLGIGGAERVVLELHKLYPDAPIFTSQYDPKRIDLFLDADVRTGWLQKLPAGLKKFLPVLRAWYFSHLDLSDYDLIISSSGAEAKAVRTRKDATHICYMHAPTHYYWSRYDEYLKNPGFGRFNFLARVGLRILATPMRRWDRHAARNPDVLLANSTHDQAEIKKYYKRDSIIVFPPVETARFKTTGKPASRHGFVIAGRQAPYKRIDLAIEACNELDIPLIVIGNGPEHRKLEKLAGRKITFLTNVSDSEMVNHFSTALGFIFPGREDFGIVAVEALAAGTPLIAYKKGGSLDFVTPKTGVFFEKQTVKSLVAALESFNPNRYDPDVITEFAQQFSVAAFHKNMKAVISDSLK